MRTLFAWGLLALVMGAGAGCSTSDEPPLTQEERLLQKRIERRDARGEETGSMKRRAAEMRIHERLRNRD